MLLFKALALAATAAAYLVVPEVSEADEGTFRTLPIDVTNADIPTFAWKAGIDVPCKSCRGHNTKLTMDFEVVDSKTLTLHGFDLYPQRNPEQGSLMASVVKEHVKCPDQKLGYSLAIAPEDGEWENMKLTNIRFKIIQVGNRFVDDIPTITVKVIEMSPTGDILIGSVDIDESRFGHKDKDHKHHDDKPCTTASCRFEKTVHGLWGPIKGAVRGGCHGRKGAHHGKPGRFGHKEGGHHHHGGHRFSDDNDSWAKLFKSFILFFCLPILSGIVCGVCFAMYVLPFISA